MKAAVLYKLNSPLEIKDLKIDAPFKTGQILVKILVSGICGSQLQEISGNKGNEKFLPHLMGHEGYGEVIDSTYSTKPLKAGDRVILHWRKSDGIDAPPYKYSDDSGKNIGAGPATTLSEMAVVSENRLTKVSDDANGDVCALLGCGLSTAMSIVDNEVSIKFGDKCLVIGAGGVGGYLCHFLTVKGADCYYIDRAEKNLKNKRVSFNEAKSVKFNYIFDTVGDLNVSINLMSYMESCGKMILVGQPKKDKSFLIDNPNSIFGPSGTQIILTQGGNFNPSKDIEKYLKYLSSHTDIIKQNITHRFKLPEINQAFNKLSSGECGRILIYPNEL